MIRPLGAAHILRRLIVNRDPFPLRPWWNREERRILVQSYIEGRPSNCAVVCKDGRLLAGIAVDVVSSLGPTGPATIVRVVDSPAMLGCAERLAHRLKLTGFFGLDFVIEDGSGDTYLIEMNPRGTPLCHLQLGKGRDMIDALWAQLSNRPPRETPPVTQSDLIAYFPQAWQAIAELPPSSYQDIPPDEPELVREILHPWPDRSLLARAYNQIWECWLRLTSESTPSPTLKG
jgi:predicted ATP-grasp superfamily ATP-dependent carboligase